MVHSGFWWVRVDHFREHHGSPRVWGGVRVDHFREHHGSPQGYGGFVLITFVSTMVHPRVLGGSC